MSEKGGGFNDPLNPPPKLRPTLNFAIMARDIESFAITGVLAKIRVLAVLVAVEKPPLDRIASKRIGQRITRIQSAKNGSATLACLATATAPLW